MLVTRALFVLGVLVAVVAVVAVVASQPASAEPRGREVQSPAVDEARVVVDRIPSDGPLAFRRFGTDDTDLGTGSDPKDKKKHEAALSMKRVAPPLLETAFQAEAEENGSFPSVVILTADEPVPDGAVLVEGRFTLLNPGSRGKRFWVGLGAGKSKVCVEGRVLDPEGELAATFSHCRSGTMGFYGGRAEALMATDLAETGERLADFVHHLALGLYEGR